MTPDNSNDAPPSGDPADSTAPGSTLTPVDLVDASAGQQSAVPDAQTPDAQTPPQSTSDDASAEQPLRTDGPTLAEYLARGYDALTYPPAGFAVREESAEPSDAIDPPQAPAREATGLSVHEPSGDIEQTQAPVDADAPPATQ